MKKIDNKGFLLVETLVVSTFVLGVLIILFLQFKTLLINYNHTYDYNTVEGVYNLNAVKTYLNENQNNANSLNSILISSEKPYLIVYDNDNNKCNSSLKLENLNYCNDMMGDAGFEKVIYTKSEVSVLKRYMKNEGKEDTDLNESLRNFINRLDDKKSKNRLIAEYKNKTFASITYGVNNE